MIYAGRYSNFTEIPYAPRDSFGFVNISELHFSVVHFRHFGKLEIENWTLEMFYEIT